MATRPNRELTVGEIIDKTLTLVSRSGLPALMFILFIGAAGTVADVFVRKSMQVPSVEAIIHSTAYSLLLTIVKIIASYPLVVSMMKRSGLMTYKGDWRLIGFIGMELLVMLGVIGGLILVIIPAFIFMARWSAAPALFAGRGDRVFAAMGDSWKMTKGHEFPIILASLAMLAIFYAIAIVPPFMFPNLPLPLNIVTKIAGAAANVISIAVGIVVYGLLKTRDASGALS
ncbi:MAG: hypothetical protein P0Y56_00550 [Candidatus Andeanibacterium colombiense]|uniref:Glycerophosphoryl diester phosphodiesterase membrane domain-containing protein n=1 Tax=Candidatus Andeanibacterium colombiense TaxID=3121345 RepID=A0AAJ5X6N1_9SPHN|nr:MAG: hypothetical protein P0Y56_00550 [Sphingomonadaceae bacterium]